MRHHKYISWLDIDTHIFEEKRRASLRILQNGMSVFASDSIHIITRTQLQKASLAYVQGRHTRQIRDIHILSLFIA